MCTQNGSKQNYFIVVHVSILFKKQKLNFWFKNKTGLKVQPVLILL